MTQQTRKTTASLVLVAVVALAPAVGAASVVAQDGATQDEVGPTAELEQGVVTQQRGDNATVNISLEGTDNATVAVGSRDVNYRSVVTVRDTDGDGTVQLDLNTFAAGRDANQSGGFTTPAGDEIVSYELVTPTLSTPLEAGSYNVTVRVGDERTDVGALLLTQGSLGDAQTWTAPDEAGPTNVGELLDAVSQSDTIAQGDWAVVEVQASGVYGYLRNQSDLNSEALGTETTIEEVNLGPNEEPQNVSLDNVGLLRDPDNNQFFLLVDTDELEAGSDYRAQFGLTEDNPYAETNQSVTANFSVVEPQVSIDAADTGPLQLATGNATVSGNSTLAPGSQFRVEVQSLGENPFLRTQQVTVGQNGSWDATFDLSGIPNGTEAQLLVQQFNITRDVVVVEQVQQPQAQATTVQTETTTTTTTTTTETTTTTTTETTTTTTTTTETTTEGGGGPIPGFGVGAAIVALLAAAVVALRQARKQ